MKKLIFALLTLCSAISSAETSDIMYRFVGVKMLTSNSGRPSLPTVYAGIGSKGAYEVECQINQFELFTSKRIAHLNLYTNVQLDSVFLDFSVDYQTLAVMELPTGEDCARLQTQLSTINEGNPLKITILSNNKFTIGK